jgi:hypothetical protein
MAVFMSILDDLLALAENSQVRERRRLARHPARA